MCLTLKQTYRRRRRSRTLSKKKKKISKKKKQGFHGLRTRKCDEAFLIPRRRHFIFTHRIDIINAVL